MNRRLVLGIAIIQTILLLAHWFLDQTLIFFLGAISPETDLKLKIALFLLSISFVLASLLGFRFVNPVVSLLYRLSAIWLGFMNYLFIAAILCWIVWLTTLLSEPQDPTHARLIIAAVVFGLALAISLYGLVNAYVIRTRSVPVHLPNLPPTWSGRTALLISDLHLGQINQAAFTRRIVKLAKRLNPDVVFIAGDFFDGMKVDADRAAAPFGQLSPPFGTFFATGNHDEFSDPSYFISALERAGIRVLQDEKVIIDGLQIAGINHLTSTNPIRMDIAFKAINLDRSIASIFLNHVPSHLPITEQAGVTLQLSGHTHGGQFIPFTWLTWRIFRKFTHGLNSHGTLQVFTSCGAGTWGPPIRVGTTPEVVLLKFE